MCDKRYKIYVEGDLEIMYCDTLKEGEKLALKLARKYPLKCVMVSDTQHKSLLH